MSELIESSDDEKEIMERNWKKNIAEIEKVPIFIIHYNKQYKFKKTFI